MTKMKLPIRQIKLFCTLALALVSLSSHSLQVLSNQNGLKDFENEGRPNKTRSGVNRSLCALDKDHGDNTGIKVTALAPEKTRGGTIKERPTLWFYIDYPDPSSQSTLDLNFILLRDENKTMFLEEPVSVKLTEQNNFVGISLPSEQKLKNEWYIWQLTVKFTVMCDEEKISKKTSVGGWIKPIQETSDLATESVQTKLELTGYDDLDSLARNLCEDRENTELQTEWKKILEDIGLGDIANKPMDKCYY